MLRCLGGICGGASVPKGAAEGRVVAKKPVLEQGEAYAPASACPSGRIFLAQLGLESAPPGAETPLAVVCATFQRNSKRLLVVLPAPGSSWDTWDDSLSGDRGKSAPLVRWAAANGYALCLFAPNFSAAPAASWDNVLRGSPARFVAVAAAGTAMPFLREALTPLHPLMYSRVRVVLASESEAAAAAISSASKEVRKHLERVTVPMPQEWVNLEPFALHACIFQLLEERIDIFQSAEVKKYTGFQGMKENDVPGLRRLPLDSRIKRMDRDRNDDELARLLKKHENSRIDVDEEDEDEPGVD